MSELKVLDIWYANMLLEHLQAKISDKDARQRAQRSSPRLASGASRRDFPKLAAMSGANPKIKDNPRSSTTHRERRSRTC